MLGKEKKVIWGVSHLVNIYKKNSFQKTGGLQYYKPEIWVKEGLEKN